MIERAVLLASAVLIVSQALRPPASFATGRAIAASSDGFPLSASDEEAKAPQKFLRPASADGLGRVAVFGASAREVSIYSLGGRLMFQQTRQGSAPLVWDCKDRNGRIAPSGVYIAKILTTETTIVYQSFALVK